MLELTPGSTHFEGPIGPDVFGQHAPPFPTNIIHVWGAATGGCVEFVGEKRRINRRGTFIASTRRGMLVMPVRRGMPVMPDEAEWMIQRGIADLTSRSLRTTDATSASLRGMACGLIAPRTGNLPANKTQTSAAGCLRLGRCAVRAVLLLWMLTLVTVLGSELPAETPPSDVFGQRRPLLEIDEPRLLAAGLQKIAAEHLTLYTDCPISEEINQLGKVFDAAYPQWCHFFGVTPGERPWRMRGFLIRDADQCRRLGILPEWLPPFGNGYSVGDILWCYEQASDYYRRHLLLHEGTHGFVRAHFGDAVPPWYNEGIAELLGTHFWDGNRLILGYVPRSREESPLWGRVKIVRDAVEKGQALSLEEVLNFGPTAHREVGPYGWCWAATALFDHDPRFRNTFRSIITLSNRPDFNQQFLTRLGDRWHEAQWQWMILTSNLNYGYDFEREACNFARGQALLPSGGVVRVVADRGWQNSRLWLEAGRTYSLTARGRYIVVQDQPPWESEPQGITIRYVNGKPLGVLLAAIIPDAPPDPRTELATPGSFFQPYVVGRELVLSPPRSGTLLLRINDAPAELADNQGDVTVTVQPIGGS